MMFTMTSAEFRTLALSFPDAIESSHMGHPDFRAGNKIFATFPKADEKAGMIKLTPEQQAMFVKDAPGTFEPVPGGWGRGGATLVKFKTADKAEVRRAMEVAWKNVTSKKRK
jgi:hypothetical protein